MKIQCDACNKDEASVFCSADEAALCEDCDHRVHHANKLASKHQRFSLYHPSSSSSNPPPCCDICQEKRAFLFCREDRAILCRDCDLSIHTVNELTQKHNRFLLTGVKLSSTSKIFSSSTITTNTSSSSDIGHDNIMASVDSKYNTTTMKNTINNYISTTKKKKKIKSTSTLLSPQDVPSYQQQPFIQNSTNSSATPSKVCDNQTITTSVGGGTTSSISEYLMEMLPGWQVEDLLLDSCSAHPNITHGNGFSKNDLDIQPFIDANFLDHQANNQLYFPSQDLSLWVPEAPVIPIHNPSQSDNTKTTGLVLKELKENPITNSKLQVNLRRSDHGFTVPEINPQSNKRSRPHLL